MVANRVQEAISLAAEIVDEFEGDQGATAAVLMKCLRLARLTRNDNLSSWVSLELRGYSGADPKAAEQAATWSGRWFERDQDGKKQWFYYTASLPALVEQAASEKTLLPLQKVPDDLSYAYARGEVTNPLHTDQPNLGLQIVNRIQAQQRVLAASITSTAALITRIKTNIYEYAVRVLDELKYSSYVESAFHRARVIVDGKLKDVCPLALKQFAAAFDSGLSQNEEHWAQAMASCRRILLTVANVLFPPRTAGYVCRDKTQLLVGGDQYLNRLHAFIDQHVESKSSRTLLTALVKALYGKVCKGVHDVVDGSELSLALTSTYWIVGELLSLCPPDFAFGDPQEAEVGAAAEQLPND